MKIIKTIINIILSFVLVLIMLVIIGKSIITNKLLKKEFFIEKMNETEVYLQVSRAVQNGFENYIYQSGLPEDTIKDLYTDEMIKNDVDSLINCMFDGTEVTDSSEIVRNNLDDKISKYLNEQGLKINEQGRKNIKEFEDLIVQEYSQNVNSSTTLTSTLYSNIHDVIVQIQNIINKIGIIPIIAFVIVIIIMIAINYTDLLVAIQYVSISALSVGVLIKIGVNLIFKNFDIDNFVLFSTAMTNLVITIIKEILYRLSDNANIFIVCGIVGIVVSAILKSTNEVNEKVIEK